MRRARLAALRGLGAAAGLAVLASLAMSTARAQKPAPSARPTAVPSAAATAAPSAAATAAPSASATASATGAASAAPSSAPVGPPEAASCTEYIPEGATRPEITESFPDRGTSGYASNLEVVVKHGKGETVLPAGYRVQASSDAAKGLASAGFALPEPDSSARATLERTETDSGATTKLTIPFVPLPKEAGRNEMTLPPVPIAVERASGTLVTVCTSPHPIRVEDPTANESDPKVKPNPPGRPQREEWVLARQVSIGALIGAIIVGIGALLYGAWKKLPKLVKPVPRRPPWEVALEELDAIRVSTLLSEGKTDIYFDRVSNAVRKYLGARYGFDGLETTTDEMRGLLKRVRPPIQRLTEIISFLEDCDLVKFARVIPSDIDCTDALEKGETIVHMTIPPAVLAQQAAAKEAA